MKKRYTLCLLLLLPFCLIAQSESNRRDPFLFRKPLQSSWVNSSNPCGIQYRQADSLSVASAGYLFTRTPLPLSGQPEQEQRYGAHVEGLQHFGRLTLSGELGWQQVRQKGQQWNLLTGDDCLISVGDTLGEPKREEHYTIRGKASYAFSPYLTAGIAADYSATDNRHNSPEKRYTGEAHQLALATGLIYHQDRLRYGMTAGFYHRTEQFDETQPPIRSCYIYPLGYFIPVGQVQSYLLYGSTANGWNTGIQLEWSGDGWSWFNECQTSGTHFNLSPEERNDKKGWKEEHSELEYHACITFEQDMWTHRFSPSLRFRLTTADQYLRHANPDDLNAQETVFATVRLAGRKQPSATFGYELVRNEKLPGEVLAWQFTAGWQQLGQEFYSYPLTVGQQINRFGGEIAFLRIIGLNRNDRLSLRPSLSFCTGSGTKETVSSADKSLDTQIGYDRSQTRLNNDFDSQTATRLHAGLDAGYRCEFTPRLAAGLSLQAQIEQVTSPRKSTGGYAGLRLSVWFR